MSRIDVPWYPWSWKRRTAASEMTCAVSDVLGLSPRAGIETSLARATAAATTLGAGRVRVTWEEDVA